MRAELTELQQLAPLSDEDVAARVVAGDTGAFELLMRRHNQRLFRTARAVLLSEADAMDALQEAYIRIYRGLRGFEQRSTLVTWMTRIVLSESLRFRERRVRVDSREKCGLQAALFDHHVEPLEPVMDGMERVEIFDEAMAMLSERERSVVMLRIVQELSTGETAASLGISESNVKVILFRAKPKLTRALEGSGVEEIRRQLTFDGQRCDHLVESVFRRLECTGEQPSER
jgi:RNA polymerase sigma-70 factor (ECF subfamily)